MFKYLAICALISHCIWAKPVQQHSDMSSHLVILTPQAQVHLEPSAKFSGATFIHHLSPYARIAAPHDETIVYVPASAAAPVIPIEALAHHIGRSSGAELTLTPISASQLKQQDQGLQSIQQAIEQAQSAATSAQTAAQEGFGHISEQFAEAAASFSPVNFFPQPSGGSSQQKDEKLKERIETPANTKPLLSATGRQFYTYAAPAIPHIVDFVHGGAPVLVSSVSTIRARSLEDASQVPIIAVPFTSEDKPESLPLKTDLKSDELKKEQLTIGILNAAAQEKAVDVGRFLEASALKEDSKPEKLNSLPLEQQEQQQGLTGLSLNKIAEGQAELIPAALKSFVDGGVVDAVAASKNVVPVVDDVAQEKVA